MAFKISYKIVVSDGFTKNLKQFKKLAGKIPPQMAKVAAKVSRSFKKMGAGIKSLRDKTAIASVAMVAGFATILSSIVEFETEMNNIEANSFATGEEMKKLREAAREMGATTAFSAGQAAQALAVLARAGFGADKAIKTLPSVLNLAAAGSIGMAEAASIMTVAMAGMELGADQVDRIGDTYAYAAANAKTSVLAIGSSMVKGGKAAAGNNIALEMAVAASAILQDAGTEAGTVGRGFAKIFRVLAAPLDMNKMKQIKTARQEYVKFWPEINKAMKKGDLVSAAKILKTIQYDTNELAELFGGNFYLDANKLAQNSHLLEEMYDGIMKAKGISKKMADIKMKGIVGEIAKLKSAFGELILILADSGLTSFFIEAFQTIRKFIGYLSKTNPTLLKLILIIAGIVAVAAPLLAVLGLIAAGIAAIASFPLVAAIIAIIGLIVGAFVALNYALTKFSETKLFKGATRQLERLLNLVDKLKAKWESVFGKSETKLNSKWQRQQVGNPLQDVKLPNMQRMAQFRRLTSLGVPMSDFANPNINPEISPINFFENEVQAHATLSKSQDLTRDLSGFAGPPQAVEVEVKGEIDVKVNGETEEDGVSFTGGTASNRGVNAAGNQGVLERPKSRRGSF